MTLFEAIKANPVFVYTKDETINSALIQRGYDGLAEYTGTDEQVKQVALASADLYVLITLQPSWKEGQLSVTNNYELIKSQAIAIYNRYNDPAGDRLGDRDVSPTISDASDYA